MKRVPDREPDDSNQDQQGRASNGSLLRHGCQAIRSALGSGRTLSAADLPAPHLIGDLSTFAQMTARTSGALISPRCVIRPSMWPSTGRSG